MLPITWFRFLFSSKLLTHQTESRKLNPTTAAMNTIKEKLGEISLACWLRKAIVLIAFLLWNTSKTGAVISFHRPGRTFPPAHRFLSNRNVGGRSPSSATNINRIIQTQVVNQTLVSHK